MKKWLCSFLAALMLVAAPGAYATISDTYTPELQTGDGAEVDFDFAFKIFSATDLVVAIVDPDTLVGVEQEYGVDYTVVIDTATPSGTITFATAPDDEDLVSIKREMPVTQTTDIPSGGLFREAQIENALDKNVLMMQQLQEEVDRAVLQNPYVTTIDIVIPAPVADKILGWNAAGTALENKVAIDDDVAAAAAASAAAALVSQNAAAASAVTASYGTLIISVFDAATALETGDGKVYVTLPAALTGKNLVSVQASVYTTSSSGTPTVQVARGRRATASSTPTYVDMLSTLITIDAGEYDSSNATAAAVIDATKDDVLTADVIRIDVDVAGTSTAGLDVQLKFVTP